MCKAWRTWEGTVDFFGKRTIEQACLCNSGECPQCGRLFNEATDGVEQVLDADRGLDIEDRKMDKQVEPPDPQGDAQGAFFYDGDSGAEGAFVGLEVTEYPPHYVKKIDDLVDVNFTRWDAPGYSNPPINIRDSILQIDGRHAEHVTLDALHSMLTGELHSTVTLSMARSGTGERYTVVALRHGFHSFEAFKASSAAPLAAPTPLDRSPQSSWVAEHTGLYTSQRSATAADLYISQRSVGSGRASPAQAGGSWPVFAQVSPTRNESLVASSKPPTMRLDE